MLGEYMFEQLIGCGLTTLVGLVLTYLFTRTMKRVESEARHANEEREAAKAERDLMRRVSKTTTRAQLVQMHTQFIGFGNVDDSQRVAYDDLNTIYLELCNLTDDKNGVIEKYYHDIMSLPEWRKEK